MSFIVPFLYPGLTQHARVVPVLYGLFPSWIFRTIQFVILAFLLRKLRAGTSLSVFAMLFIACLTVTGSFLYLLKEVLFAFSIFVMLE